MELRPGRPSQVRPATRTRVRPAAPTRLVGLVGLTTLVGLVGLALVTGCGGGGAAAATDQARERWQRAGLTDYSYVLDSQCGEQALIGRFRITVRGGAVVAADGLDEPGQRLVADLGLSYLPTIDGVFDIVQQALAGGADVVDVTFDPTTGHPTSVDIDLHRNAVDDESCFEISELRQG